MRAQGLLDGSVPILSIATPDSTSVCTGSNEDASISNNLVDCALEIKGNKVIINVRKYFIFKTLVILILRLRLSDFVDDLETTDRSTVRAIAVARRIDVAIVLEVQAVGVFIVRRSRPIEAGVADIVETAIVAVATTRSRIPDGGGTAELAGEVHAFIGTVVK